MRASELESLLVDWTAKNSGHHERRAYIGLSGIGDCPRRIYDTFRNGQHWETSELLRTRLSFELEEALVNRLMAAGVYAEAPEICLYDGLVQGHLDGLVKRDGRYDVLEIKTVPTADAIPRMGEPPSRKVTWQCQAYLHYVPMLQRVPPRNRWALVLYLARDSGQVAVKPLRYDEDLGRRIQAKVDSLVQAVRGVERPGCECGRCG